MSFFRHYRLRIGVLLALVMFGAAGLPGLAAAAQGVQFQAPLCTPNGPEPAENSDTRGVFDHCQICPLAKSPVADLGERAGEPVAPYVRSVETRAADAASATLPRAELMPLKGRAPPTLT
tara:strand:- start:2857 stop:3216 length:360 start_codon:yes stop_codon:yes gene_type:complete